MPRALLMLTILVLACGASHAGDGFSTNPDGTLTRIPWNDSHVVGSPEPPPPYSPVREYPQLDVKRPVYLKAEPGTNRMILLTLAEAERGPATLRAFDDSSEASTTEVLLDSDRQLLGFTFHPNYEENGYLFAHSNGPDGAKIKQNRIVRFTVDRQPPHAIVPGSELVILEWDSNGHNGGDLGFGPDGCLYCPTGDGTSDSDTDVTGQGLNDLLAVMLRLDVDHPAEGKQYSIPPDNPYINVPGARPEIWAVGFRNPWRMDYDHKLDQLWVTQNGQDLWEQVYLVRRGENYGWSVNEGSHPFYLERKTDPVAITNPTAEHHHSEARSLTGGIVYWGEKCPDLQGAYIYGDYSTGKIWAIKHDGTRVTEHREIADTALQLVGFALNRAGDLLVIDLNSGIYKLEPTPPNPDAAPFPQLLSETGLFAAVAGHEVHPALIPYSVNVELWSDGAHKARWIAVPGDGQLKFGAERGWELPEGSVLVKSFALEQEAGRPESRRWVETRLMTRQQGEWIGYSYLWNDEQTDARLVESAGRDVAYSIADPSADNGVRLQTWHYPSRAECMVCHSRAAKYVLGITTHQLNRE
ncbi:MAG: PQQ-dependent sugar dehydrogenase, partial [Planctomycetaceae bacterium]|nr:PQQ-dependent sugar dehydrogenase [Planctomycetaceae bacterium]